MNTVWRDPMVIFGLGLIVGGALAVLSGFASGGGWIVAVGIGLTAGRLARLVP